MTSWGFGQNSIEQTIETLITPNLSIANIGNEHIQWIRGCEGGRESNPPAQYPVSKLKMSSHTL